MDKLYRGYCKSLFPWQYMVDICLMALGAILLIFKIVGAGFFLVVLLLFLYTVFILIVESKYEWTCPKHQTYGKAEYCSICGMRITMVSKRPFKCPKGHRVSLVDTYCSECGEKVIH